MFVDDKGVMTVFTGSIMVGASLKVFMLQRQTKQLGLGILNMNTWPKSYLEIEATVS